MSVSQQEIMLMAALEDAKNKLGDSLVLGTAADQRAINLSAILIAAATGAILALLTSNSNAIPVQAGSLLTACMFFIGAWMCLSSAGPKPIATAGSEPDFWQHYIDRNLSLKDVHVEQLKRYQERIDHNIDLLAKNGKTFRRGAFLGLFAPACGGIFYGALKALDHCYNLFI